MISPTAILPLSPLPPLGDRKLRVLCLHGYMQNAEVFRSRIGSLRKALKSRVDFVFMDAPFASQHNSDGTAGSQGLSWWQWTDLEPGTRPSRAAQYSGWDASQAAIQAALEAHAPIDGLLGFSQGATAAALYLAHTSTDDLQQHQLRFSVHIAGFLPRDEAYAAALRQGRPRIKSLHVNGAVDELVPQERTQALADCWDQGNVRIFTHPGAHMVPTCSGAFKAVLVELLEDVRQGREVTSL